MAIQVDLATLKQLAHNAQPLLEAAGLSLGHKQCLEMVARMHGYENFETAKGTLDKASQAAMARAGKDAPEVPGSPEHMARRRRQAAIAVRIGEELQTEPEKIIGDLCGAGIAALAKRYPGKLSQADRSTIRTNYPEATDDLIDERAMDQTGVMVTLATAKLMAQIAVDYCTDSAFKADIDRDAKVGPTVGAQLGNEVLDSIARAVEKGLTPFGAMCTTVLVGTHSGKSAKLPVAKMVRPLLDGITLAMESKPTQSVEEAEEAAMQYVMTQMGINKAAARKYLAAAKKMHAEGKMK